MGHVSLVSHEALVAVVASEGEVAGVPALVADQLVPVAELLLAVLTCVSKHKICNSTTGSGLYLYWLDKQ